MEVYRIGKTRYARDLTGEGARLYGGRWNNVLTPCVYTSESRALALLEYTVNVNADEIPKALSITTFEISDKNIKTLLPADLPRDWLQAPAPASAKEFGTALLKKGISVIKIPSCIIPGEFNYLLNPAVLTPTLFKITSVEDFRYDIRIKS